MMQKWFNSIFGRVLLVWLAFVSVGPTRAFSGGSQVDWPTLGFTQFTGHTFNSPTFITHAGDGSQRLFVTEKTGNIWIIQSNSVLAQPFLNITNRVLSSGNEQGILSLAFAPGFATNGHFYVAYTRKTDGDVTISRFQMTTNSNLGDSNSEQVLLTIPQVYLVHNAGQLGFGPDGYLYIGKGDGGYDASNGIGDPFNNAQNTSVLLGKILRIDVESGAPTYLIPPSNPFVGATNAATEIWAYGLRNPWRFSFDRQTGDLYIGDVGHFEYEEIDFQPAGSTGGQNYGWRILEGPFDYNVPSGFTNFSTLTEPVAWYDHGPSNGINGSAAVIGGYVCRATNHSRLNGVYIYGDYVTGQIYGLKQVNGNWTNQVLLPFNTLTQKPNYNVSTFGEDDEGQLYMTDYPTGRIFQIQDMGGPPSLQINLAANQAAIAWPSWADQFKLEVCSNLFARGQWTAVTNGITTRGNSLVLTNTVAATSLFYRLHK